MKGYIYEGTSLYAREQMGIRTNVFFGRKLLANFSRTNGDSAGKLLSFRENGNIFIKKLVK